MSKFSISKKWPKSVGKLENGGRLEPIRQDLPPRPPPPQKKKKRSAGSASVPWIRPCCSYQLEIFRECPQICFRRNQKISGSQLKPFGRYLRKT